MRRLRLRSTLAAQALFLLTACLAVGVPGASAADPLPNTGITQLSSEHFTIFFSRSAETSCPTRFISNERAADVLRMAERAFGFYSSWGYTTPWSGTPLHISVDEFDKAPNICITDGAPIDPLTLKNPDDGTLTPWDGFVDPVTPVPGGTDEIHLEGTGGKGLNYQTVAREVFYLFGRKMDQAAWNPPPPPPAFGNQWLPAASAEWAMFRTDGFGTVTSMDLAGSPGRSLDCVGTECGAAGADADRNGYAGWLFLEYLAERFGNDAVKELWAPSASAVTQLSGVLATHGTTLSTFFNDFAAARLAGKFSVAPLTGALPPTQDPPLAVPQASGAVPGAVFGVNHLAAAYVKLAHGGSATAACYEAKLSLTVSIPAGVTSTPYFYANTVGAVAQPFTVSGSTASLVNLPWNSCAGSPAAYVVIPNTTSDLDAREFVLNGSVSVDRTKPASPSAPPAHVPVGTPVIVVPTTDPAPTVALHAPEVLRVSAKTRLLRFIVFASGDGRLQAALGSTALGSPTVHAGNNDVRFILPKQLFNTLRVKSTNNLLTLTSLSSSGARGMTLTRRVAVQATPKPKRRH